MWRLRRRCVGEEVSRLLQGSHDARGRGCRVRPGRAQWRHGPLLPAGFPAVSSGSASCRCPPILRLRLPPHPTPFHPIPPHPTPPSLPRQAKTKELKSSFNEQFSSVHELCLMVLNASQKPDLIRATLATLHAFLSWVPLGYIFESNVTEVGGWRMGR